MLCRGGLGISFGLGACAGPSKTVSGDRTLNLARNWINLKIDECCTPRPSIASVSIAILTNTARMPPYLRIMLLSSVFWASIHSSTRLLASYTMPISTKEWSAMKTPLPGSKRSYVDLNESPSLSKCHSSGTSCMLRLRLGNLVYQICLSAILWISLGMGVIPLRSCIKHVCYATEQHNTNSWSDCSQVSTSLAATVSPTTMTPALSSPISLSQILGKHPM